ncbi:MAG: hypothetical protein U0353_35480 [Sandaracinus sp.]
MSVDASAILAAGGVLPLDRATEKSVTADVVAARTFTHPALPGRKVVRVIPQNLARGVDLEMETIGFAAGEGVEVGRERRRALGFPGWALVHDPKNARYALEVVRDLKKAARRAKSKPGHAKEGIDAIAETLGKSVPGFLPSFFEEAGRAFLEADAHSYAAQYFEKAREAERVHALKIDEDVRRDAFLEFALAGAVAIKSLSAYAKDLEKSRSPAEAYAQFRRLSIQRTLGGLPPWGGMAKELARLAKLAGLDPATEASGVIAEILESPSLKRAPADFWAAYDAPIVALAKGSPRIRGALLALFPDPTSGADGFDDAWLDLLARAGALDALYDASAPPEAQPSEGAAAWIRALYAHTRRGWRPRALSAALFDVVTRAAPRLRAEGKPLAFVWRHRMVDLDLSEHALALGLTIADLPAHPMPDFASWSGGTPERGRDLVHVMAHPTLGPMVVQGLDAVVGTQPFESVARGKKSLYAARRAWLVGSIEAAAASVPALDHALDRVAAKTSVASFQEIEGAHAALVAADPARSLATTLRAGLGGELGWAAYDEAVRELDPESKGRVTAHGIFPYLSLTDDARVIVLGPSGRELTHDLAVPKGMKLALLRFAGGSLVVLWRDAHWKVSGYWSHAPSEVFELGTGHHGMPGVDQGVAFVRADGGVVEGGRVLRAGDRTFGGRHLEQCSDGVTVWTREYADGGFVLREVDPATGQAGRRSMPQFFESWKREGMALQLAASWLYPLPASVTSSPLGQKDGLAGLRTRIADAKSPHAASVPARELEGIEGRRWESSAASAWPLALVRWPGEPSLRAVVTPPRHAHRPPVTGPGQGSGLAIADARTPDTIVANATCATPMAPTSMLPLPFWHYFTPRDERGSRALRAVTDDAARALLDARRRERPRATALDAQGMQDELARVLPDVTDPALRREILFAVDRAAQLSEKLVDLVRTRDPSGAQPALVSDALSKPLGKTLEPLLRVTGGRSDAAAIVESMRTFSRFARRDARAEGEKVELRPATAPWPELAGRVGALAYLAASPATAEAHRETLLALLEAWADTVLVEPGRTFTFLTATGEGLPSGVVVTTNGSDYFGDAAPSFTMHAGRPLLAHTPAGAAHVLPPRLTVSYSRPANEAWGTAERLKAFVADVRANGPWAWSEEAVVALGERTGLTRAEAALVLAGFPEVLDWGPPLSEPIRILLGLKAPHAKAAIAALRPVSRASRVAMLAAAMPLEPAVRTPLGAGPKDEESLVARLARGWVAQRGQRARVPEELVAQAAKELKGRGSPAEVLAMFASPDDAVPLTQDAKGGPLPVGNPFAAPKATPTPGFTAATAADVATYFAWLAPMLPVGDPIRANLPKVLAHARARLAYPELEVHLTQRYGAPADPHWQAAALDLVSATGDASMRDDGKIVARVANHVVVYTFRPARIESEADWERVAAIRKTGYTGSSEAPIRILRSEGLTAIAARIEHTPVPVGAYETCPLHAAPALVAAARQRFGLSEDAAVLYLQTLALVAPTKKSVEAWNGWTGARYGKAAAELVKAELVLEAKRERAGRAHFLPGGWEALDAPFLPLETWKLPLYELKEEGAQITGPLRFHLALRPLHEIFERAWSRVESGDAPRYEEVASTKSKAKTKKGKQA